MDGQTVVKFAKRMQLAVMSTCFRKEMEHRVTCKSEPEMLIERDWRLYGVVRGECS